MTLISELRLAGRTIRRAPGTTAFVVLTLAIGIAANTTIFSVVDTVVLRPLPYAQPDRLVIVNELRTSRSQLISVSYADFGDWRGQTRDVFAEMAARNTETFNLTGMGLPEQVTGSNVSWQLFRVLRVRAAAGRLFGPGDDRPGPGARDSAAARKRSAAP